MIQLDYFLYQLKVKLISFHVDYCLPPSATRKLSQHRFTATSTPYQPYLLDVPSYFSLGQSWNNLLHLFAGNKLHLELYLEHDIHFTPLKYGFKAYQRI